MTDATIKPFSEVDWERVREGMDKACLVFKKRCYKLRESFENMNEVNK